MGLAEYRSQLKSRGINATEAMIRGAIKYGRLPMPVVDMSHRYNFSTEDVEKAVDYFSTRKSSGRRSLATV